MKNKNKDLQTIAGFGDEWERFDQSGLQGNEHHQLFEKYFGIFPWNLLPDNAHGFDMGCGSGRWAILVAPRVGTLHCIDPSSAIEIAKRNLANHSNCIFYQASVDDFVLTSESMDFGYSLGVLHHIPNTAQGIIDCVRMLKKGAPFLIYLYYALDNRSVAYRMLWKLSDFIRNVVSDLPYESRYFISQLFALFIYWPLARFSAILEKIGVPLKFVTALPLSFYRHTSFYTMRTDALDRFGTSLEQRFTKEQIYSMMHTAGLINIQFSDASPYWCAVGTKGGQ